MKPFVRVLIGAGLLSGIGILVVAYFLLTPSTYEVKGRVAGINDEGQTLVVEHEEIPGYMPPMIMPLPVADTSMTASLRAGEAIRFEMRVSNDSTWISRVEAIPDTAVARNPAQSTQPVAGSDAEQDGPQPLREGDGLPADVSLVDQNGDRIEMDGYRGQVLVLTFIYTECPLPDFCPLMSERFARLQPTLRDQYGDEVQLLSISFDPATDTPAVLREYAEEYTDRLDTWTFATGDTSQVHRVTDLFRVYTEPEEGEITHNLVTAVVRPDGTVHRLFRGNDWTPEDITRAVEQIR
ncbi:MAG: SCO family protein [Salinibacter sp.]